MLTEVISLYEAYLNEFHRLERNRKPLEGAFGFGCGPQNYPCHDKFAQDLEQLLETLHAQAPTSEQAVQVLDYIYFTAPTRWKSETAVYWMLLAVHELTSKLIGRLDTSAAEELSNRYQHFYPRRQRLPVQDTVLTIFQQHT